MKNQSLLFNIYFRLSFTTFIQARLQIIHFVNKLLNVFTIILQKYKLNFNSFFVAEVIIILFEFVHTKQNLELFMEIAKIKPTNYVYNKKQMIGKGSFGEVYLGYNQKYHFPVAVKIVSFEKISALMDKETLMSKLKQEIINMQIAKNENLVQLLDAQVSSRNLYIICEYCNGESFDTFLKRKVYLTENQALNFFKKQILRGFQNLHNKKIVHRDLKPANLLMHNFNIKIADLGLSKAIDQHEQLLQSIVGTPLYMSPQIFNRQKYTQKTDIWSLGVIMYEMLYGRIPWKAKSLMQLKEKVENQSVEFPISPMVTLDTKHLIQSMLQLQQKKRVGWQDLFNQYFPACDKQNGESSFCVNSHLDMMQQKNEKYNVNFQKLFKYIDSSSYIESQHQLIKILMDLNIRKKEQIQMDNSYEKAQDFFTSKLFIDQKKLQILSYCFYYFSRRNRISYLVKIFQYLYEVTLKVDKKQSKNISPNTFANLLAAQLLIIKFSIHSLYKMLNRNVDTEEQTKVANLIQAGPCLYPKYMGILLRHDFQSFWHFSDIFMAQFYTKNMKVLETQNEAVFNEVNKQLSGFYSNQIGDYKLVKFMLMNSLRSVFNQLKSFQQKSQHQLMLTRLIYEFQRDKQLFQLGDLLQTYKSQKNSNALSISNIHDLHKKLNEWKNDLSWNKKLLQAAEMKIQNLSTFINKQFKWNPMHIYASDILN